MSGARILVVDDDPAILRVVSRALEGRGYAVQTLTEGADVERTVAESKPEAILLDLVLPDSDGIDICRAIRAKSSVPIIVLSAIGDDKKKVEALDEGADDYLSKPFSLDELLARIRVALRRQAGAARGTVLSAGPLELNIEAHSALVNGTAVHLTPKEFDLCRLLLQEQGRILTQRLILSRVWGPEYVDDSHILRTFVHQLRSKLAAASPDAARLIVNDPGVGYRLQVDKPAEADSPAR
jgi:two-component system KDP operon response regulator KdpE